MKKKKSVVGTIVRIIRIYDSFFPEMLVNFRIRAFRFFCDFFVKQNVSASKIVNFGKKNRHVFFGYYDITPFSKDDEKFLAVHAPQINRTPEFDDFAEVGLYKTNNPKEAFVSLGKTNTWCWQQGCRLQWYGNSENKIVYNCLVDDKYGAEIKEVSTGTTLKKINKPLYSVTQDGYWGLSLDFSRLQRLRPGYGYGILPENNLDDPSPSGNGIELINIDKNETRLLFSLSDISKISPHNSMEGAEHYFNHIMFNPSGNEFLFFHLWSKENKRYSRLFVAKRDGSDIKLLNNSGSVSHYNWISNNEILLYSLVDEREKYIYSIFNSATSEIIYFGKNVPRKDGHPTIPRNNRNVFVTDTYADLCSRRNLLCYEMRKDKVKVLAKFDSPKNLEGELRCDLHPRIGNNGEVICVDRILNGKRHMSLIPVDILAK